MGRLEMKKYGYSFFITEAMKSVIMQDCPIRKPDSRKWL